MSKDKEQVEKFIEALQDAGYDPKSYSGRGMYGKCCVSVSDNESTRNLVWDIAKELFNERWDGEFDNIPEPRQDQLGLGIVLYWPEYEWPEDDDDA